MPTQISYGRAVPSDMDFPRAVARIRELLKNEGFGILCEIDVAKTLKDKIGAEFRPYVILGACNPNLAHRALEAEEQLGLLLPCNVVVQEIGGKTVISAVDASKMLEVVGNPALHEIAVDANSRLQRVLDNIKP
jgi:uncharacterized protein (DUF302 family)